MERWHLYMSWIDMIKPSHPPVYRNVTEKTNDIAVLNSLENMFKRYTHVLENDFFQELMTLDTISNIINPKCVIWEMIQKYFCNLTRVYLHPDFSETFIFIFYIGDYKREFVFSNCMKFIEDVNVICFLHHITLLNVTPNYYFGRCETVQILTRLMRNKYGIDFDDIIFLYEKFTMSTIANCFPSITWDMFHNIYNNPAFSNIFIDDNSILFPDFDLPKTIFIPSIVMILPKLEDPPIAVLVAISIKLRDFYTPATEPKHSLELIYNQILEIYSYSIFPERLKLYLCMKWNIVVKENNVYKFAPCFAANRLKAKSLILKIKLNDPKLNDVLLKI